MSLSSPLNLSRSCFPGVPESSHASCNHEQGRQGRGPGARGQRAKVQADRRGRRVSVGRRERWRVHASMPERNSCSTLIHAFSTPRIPLSCQYPHSTFSLEYWRLYPLRSAASALSTHPIIPSRNPTPIIARIQLDNARTQVDTVGAFLDLIPLPEDQISMCVCDFWRRYGGGGVGGDALGDGDAGDDSCSYQPRTIAGHCAQDAHTLQ